MRWHKTDDGWSTAETTPWVDGQRRRSRRMRSADGVPSSIYVSNWLDDLAGSVGWRASIAMSVDPESARETAEDAFCGERSDFAYAVAEFARLCAYEVLADGRAVYEVAFFAPQGNRPERASSFCIRPVPNYERRLWRHGQYRPDAGWQRVSEEQLIVFRLPAKARRDVSKALRVLTLAGEHDSLLRHLRVRGYDARLHRLVEAKCVMRATRFCGWHWGPFDQHSLEPHTVTRSIAKHAFVLQLQKCVLHGLNRAMGIAGREMGFVAKLDWKYSWDEQTIGQARARLEAGECNRLVDLVNLFFGGE